MLFRFLIALVLGSLLQAQDVWLANPSQVTHQETVSGDAFFVSKEIELSGNYEEDVWALAMDLISMKGSIRFTGTAGDDVRFSALESVNVTASIQGKLQAYAIVNAAVGPETRVEGRTHVVSGSQITLRGSYGDQVELMAPEIRVEANIEGDLILRGNEITLLPGTVIQGDLQVQSPQPLPLPEGVELKGELIQLKATQNVPEWVAVITLTAAGMMLLTEYCVLLFLLRFLPRFVQQSSGIAVQHRSRCFFVGLLCTIGLFGLGLVLIQSKVGLFLGLLLWILHWLFFSGGKLVMCFVLASKLARGKALPFWRWSLYLFLSLFMLSVLFLLPTIGTGLYFFTCCWGMGASLIAIRLSQQPLKLSIPDTQPLKTPPLPKD